MYIVFFSQINGISVVMMSIVKVMLIFLIVLSRRSVLVPGGHAREGQAVQSDEDLVRAEVGLVPLLPTHEHRARHGDPQEDVHLARQVCVSKNLNLMCEMDAL